MKNKATPPDDQTGNAAEETAALPDVKHDPTRRAAGLSLAAMAAALVSACTRVELRGPGGGIVVDTYPRHRHSHPRSHDDDDDDDHGY